jgi:transglutaminase-like putative cysteine protease
VSEGSDSEDDEGQPENLKDYEVKKDVIREVDSDEEDKESMEESRTHELNLDSKEPSMVSLKAQSVASKATDYVIIDTEVKKSESQFSIYSSEDKADEYEHLSHYDPDDEFLKSRTVSVIESVISGEYKKKEGKSELSDYSIIDLSEQSFAVQNPHLKALVTENVNLIRTRRDIYAEDILMTKIIHYVSQFSYDVKSYLSKLRSKEALLSAKEPVLNEVQTAVYDIDLDSVDEAFLSILLDCLESFELYKLCLIVCNRYALTSRVGRYLVSIASKYSNLSLVCTRFNTMFHSQARAV